MGAGEDVAAAAPQRLAGRGDFRAYLLRRRPREEALHIDAAVEREASASSWRFFGERLAADAREKRPTLLGPAFADLA